MCRRHKSRSRRPERSHSILRNPGYQLRIPGACPVIPCELLERFIPFSPCEDKARQPRRRSVLGRAESGIDITLRRGFSCLPLAGGGMLLPRLLEGSVPQDPEGEELPPKNCQQDEEADQHAASPERLCVCLPSCERLVELEDGFPGVVALPRRRALFVVLVRPCAAPFVRLLQSGSSGAALVDPGEEQL